MEVYVVKVLTDLLDSSKGLDDTKVILKFKREDAKKELIRLYEESREALGEEHLNDDVLLDDKFFVDDGCNYYSGIMYIDTIN